MITRRRSLVGSAVSGAKTIAAFTQGLKFASATSSDQVSVQLSANALDNIHPVNLKCEYLTNPEGIDMQAPRFFWQLTSTEADQSQKRYQLLVATTTAKLNNNIGDAFDSGQVNSDSNTH